MANKVKASGVVTVKQILGAANPGLDAAVAEKLTTETREVFRKTFSTAWIAFSAEAEIFEAAAQALYPGDSNRLRRLGAEVAERQFKGLYKVFLTVTTVEFVIKRVAQIWGMIYDSGVARVEDISPNGATLVVLNMPEQLATQREYICGFLTALLKLTNLKNVRVTKNERDQNAWKWIVDWQRN